MHVLYLVIHLIHHKNEVGISTVFSFGGGPCYLLVAGGIELLSFNIFMGSPIIMMFYVHQQ